MEKNFLFKFRKLLNSFQHRVFTRGPRNTEEHFFCISGGDGQRSLKALTQRGCATFFAEWLCEKPLGFSCILPFKRKK